MTYMYNMIKYNYTQGIFFLFVTAISLEFLFKSFVDHTPLFHENIVDALHSFEIVSQDNKTNCACAHCSGNSAKDFQLGIHKNKLRNNTVFFH